MNTATKTMPKTIPTGATISEAEYSARRDALDELPTAALRKARAAIKREVAAAWRSASGEDHFTLMCLKEWADTLLESRINGYTGEYED